MIELVGWIASAFIVASLSMKSILKLRVLGLIGAASFATYGVLLEAWPIAVVNTTIIGIHLWFLRKLLSRPASSFRILEVAAKSDYLRSFLSFYADEIERFVPGYRYVAGEGKECWFILRDMVPAGLLIATWVDQHTMEVELDFAIPQYRDLRLGRFAFSAAGIIGEHDVTSIHASAATRSHADYLRAMGFVERDPGSFVKSLGSDTPSI